MAGTLLLRITRSSGTTRDLRYRYIWTAWMEGRLVGQGHAFKPEEAEAKALDLLSPDEVDHVEIVHR